MKQCCWRKPKNIGRPAKRRTCISLLPDDVMTIILSKLDIVTLRRFTLAFSQDTGLLPKVVSLATPLPPSMFLPDKSASWYGKPLTKLIRKITWCITTHRVPYVLAIFLTGSLCYYCFKWLNTIRLSAQATRFFQSLSGLTSMEVQLPDLPCSERLSMPNLWFRWNAMVGMQGVVDHALFVFGQSFQGEELVYNEDTKDTRFWGYLRIATRHTLSHYSMIKLRSQGGSLKSIRTKDVSRNGGMEIGNPFNKNDKQFTLMVSELPTTLLLSDNMSNDVVRVKDLVLMFVAYVDVISEEQGGSSARNDLLWACLGNFDDKRETKEKRELRQVVTQILSHGKCTTFV